MCVYIVPKVSLSLSRPTHSGVKLPRSALKYFLKHLHSQIQRNDPEGVFAEPVTDDIAPGYSSIIKQSMDLLTIGNKIDNNTYSTVDEFKVCLTYMHIEYMYMWKLSP